MSQQPDIEGSNPSSTTSPTDQTSSEPPLVDDSVRTSDQSLRYESVIRSPQTQQSMTCFLTNTTSVSQNPFSKTSSNSATTICSQSSVPNASGLTDRSSVILAPARLQTSSSYSLGNNRSDGLLSNNKSSSDKSSRLLLRPSVLRVADSSTNNSQNAQKDSKVFAFVSLSKEDISRPATTLLQSDIIRCGADTTSPFNGEEAPPVSSTSDVPTSDDNDSNSQTFVFGENLEDRAVFINKRHLSKDNNSQSDNNSNNNKKPKIDGSLKSSTDEEIRVEANAGLESNGDDLGPNPSTSGEDLKTNSDGVLDLSSSSESPDKSENKRKFEVITGEEDEQNVLSMHCRLYVWESDTSTWKERGRGSLRLNDVIKDDKLCSRIVMRTSGALRVILNAHIMAGMKFEVSNEQCLRFTNVDGIYLIKGAPKDIDQLNSAIDYRLREISKRLKSDSSQPQALEDMSNDSCLSNK